MTPITERLNERASGRFRAHREAEVAEGNEPDIIVHSVSVDAEVAIEVKHGNMKWRVADLQKALRGQLGRDYLRTPNRRFGVLVISLHRDRTWVLEGRKIDFDELIAHLQRLVSGIDHNDSGPVEVAVFGLDSRAPGSTG